MHFEARKHLLEYDDVANEQRKAIYRVRNELLDPNQNITHRIIENRQECIALLLQKAEVFSNEDDLNALCGLALEDFNITLEAEALKEYYQKHNNFETYLDRVLTQAYEEKMSSLNEKTRNEIEKLIYLQTLDNLWREHLYTMDNLKTGIGLRGYNQKDPLVEYKKESFNLFLDLIKQIKYTSIKMLHKVQLNPLNEDIQEEAKHTKLKLEQNNTHLQTNDSSFMSKKPVRNEPCPCGSGKKYKNCCGKSGPKQGILAQ